MGRARIMILAVAGVAAILLMLIVRVAVGHKPPPPVVVAQAPAQPMAQVLVARRNLTIGTRLAEGDLGWQPWPANSLNPVFITDGRAPEAAPKGATAQAVKSVGQMVAVAASAATAGPMEARYGSIVRSPILANEPVTDDKLVRGGEGGYMAVVLRQGMRAVAVPVSVATAAGGFILPGDRVDVMQSHSDPTANGGKGGFVSEVLLRNLRVLAVDQASQSPKGGQALVAATVTLEVAAQDAPILVRAKAQGEVILGLRAYSDAGGPAGRGGSGGGLEDGVVHILRDGKPTDVAVTQ
jgi:pilus assembly protein CpaB